MINNNYSKLFTEVEVASGGFTSTEVNTVLVYTKTVR